MGKIWNLKESKSNKLVIIKDKCIYKGNPKKEAINNIYSETIDDSYLINLFSIPYSYIRRIENQKRINYIKIYYGKHSEDEIIIKDEKIKKEIFNFLKEDISNFKYYSELPSIFGYAKPQFFALLITTGIFILTLFFAIEISNGNEWEGTGIFGLVIIIAHFGILKIVIGYISLLSIILISLFKKLKSRTETEILRR